jgi:hypothetical protein
MAGRPSNTHQPGSAEDLVCVGPDQKPVCRKPSFNEYEEDGMAIITDPASPSLIGSFLPASLFLV